MLRLRAQPRMIRVVLRSPRLGVNLSKNMPLAGSLQGLLLYW